MSEQACWICGGRGTGGTGSIFSFKWDTCSRACARVATQYDFQQKVLDKQYQMAEFIAIAINRVADIGGGR